MRKFLGRMLFAVTVLMAQLAPAAESQRDALIIFAAASLTDVLQQLGPQYTQSSGVPVKFSFSASSALAKQIESGAGADVFLSADQEWMNYLDERKRIQPESRQDLLGNRLVLIAPKDSRVAVDLASRTSMLDALGKNGRLATGDPDSVPVGRYAKSALTSLKLWEALEPRLARADNVRVALMYVARGESPLGIVYATDAAVEPKVRVVTVFPESSHLPITYPVAATQGAKADASSFTQFLRSDTAQAAFTQAGFRLLAAADAPATEDCTGFQFSLDEELRLFAGEPQNVAATPTAAAAPILKLRQLYEVGLVKQSDANGSYAGTLKFNSAESGTLRVTIDDAAWIDVISGGKVLKSTRHTGSKACKLLHKSVEFAVKPRGELLIQISRGSRKDIRVLVTAPESP